MSKITNTNHLILLQAAQKLGIQTKILQIKPVKIKYTYQNKSHIISEKSFGINQSKTAKQISKNKNLTLKTLKKANLPVPQHTVINQPQEYFQTIKTIPFPQAIKPLTGEKGRHIYLNIKNKAQGQSAVNQILKNYSACIIETYHQANDYRFLLLNHQLIGLSQRLSPTITGNNQSTIRQLIKAENQQRHQQYLKTNKRMLNRMRNWPRLQFNLNLQGLSLKAILPQDKTITLYPIPNFSTGGSVKIINPKNIHPSIIQTAEKASQAINLQIIGIDLLIKNLKKPAAKNNLVIIEVNSDPGLRLHDWPNQGKSQHVAEKILKYIFNL